MWKTALAVHHLVYRCLVGQRATGECPDRDFDLIQVNSGALEKTPREECYGQIR